MTDLFAFFDTVNRAAVRALAFTVRHVNVDAWMLAPQGLLGVGAKHHAGALHVSGSHFNNHLLG